MSWSAFLGQWLVLIDASSYRFDTLFLRKEVRLVVVRNTLNFFSQAEGENCSGVSSIAHISLVIYNQEDACTGPRHLNLRQARAGQPEKLFISFQEAMVNRLRYVIRERGIFNDEFVEMISQKIGAGTSSVAIEHLLRRIVRQRKNKRAISCISLTLVSAY